MCGKFGDQLPVGRKGGIYFDSPTAHEHVGCAGLCSRSQPWGNRERRPTAQPLASGAAPASPACRSAAVSADRGVPSAAGDSPPLLRAGDGGGLGDSAVPVRTAASPFCTRASERAERETGGEVAAPGAGAAAAAELGSAAPADGGGGGAVQAPRGCLEMAMRGTRGAGGAWRTNPTTEVERCQRSASPSRLLTLHQRFVDDVLPC